MNFNKAFVGLVNDLKSKSDDAKPTIPHPLDAKFQDPDKIQGWLRITLAPHRNRHQVPKLRMLTFNAVSATHNQSANNEILGNADGRPGQEYRLLHGNVIANSLELAISEAPTNLNQPLVFWNEIDSLDRAAPTDRVYELDCEAGMVRLVMESEAVSRRSSLVEERLSHCVTTMAAVLPAIFQSGRWRSSTRDLRLLTEW